MLGPETFKEAVALDLGEALRIFSASDFYPDKLLHVETTGQLEEILQEQLAQLKKMMQELILDKRLYPLIELKDLKEIASLRGYFKNSFFGDYLNYFIDMHNLKSFLRLLLCREPPEKLQELITVEGFLKKKDLSLLYQKEIALLLRYLEHLPKWETNFNYALYLAEAIQKTIQEASFIYLEKAIADFLIEGLRPARYLTCGPEPILAYYLARVNEISLVRLIILGKLYGLSSEVISLRLNKVYV